MNLYDRCQDIKLKDYGDQRGKLFVIESGRTFPFEIKRAFFIFETDINMVRGQHANIKSDFVIVNVSGNCKIKITDGKDEIIKKLSKPMEGVYIPRLLWKDIYDFSRDSMLLVLTNTYYDSTEYIRNYKEYLLYIGKDDLISN